MPSPRRLRVVHVTRGLDMGGQERLLVEFARGMDRTRFELHFLSLTTEGVLAQPLREHGWPVTALNEPEGLRPGMMLRLGLFLRRGRFDVLHTHDDKPLIYAGLASPFAGVGRFIHTHHHGPVPYIGRRQIAAIRVASYVPNRFVCVSEHSRRYLAEQGISTHRLMTLHNGIDLERFPYLGPDPAGPVVCVARLSAEKDIANLLHAAALLKPHLPDLRVEIAGNGPLREELHRLAAERNLGETVRFLGEVQDIPALLSRARLFVLPSQTEGISLTILEAMARGLPVVATHVGGNPEVVQHPATGLLVPPGDPQSLAAALRELWLEPNRCTRAGLAGRQRVEAHFDVRVMLRRYEQLYLSGP